MRRIILGVLIAVLMCVSVSAQLASLPYQLQWGEKVQGGQVYQNDKFIIERLERSFVSAYQNSISVNTASTTIVDAPTEYVDKGSDMDGSGTYTIPFTGYYRVSAQVDWESNGLSTTRKIYVVLASTTTVLTAQVTASESTSLTAAKTIKATAAQWLDLWLYQESGSTLLATVSWQIEALPWQ